MKISQKRSCLSWAIVLYILVIANTAYSQVTLTPSIHHAPYNISCFGGSDGSISLAVSGGVAPYKYTWSNGATTQNISNVPAGYYSVVVQDAGTLTWNAEITLIEPRDLEVIPLAYKYPNEYNISLNGACNGMIAVTVNNGVPPYSYLWRDGNTTLSRTALCRGSYGLILTDANGCSVSTETIDLSEPERSDWTMTGNTGSNPQNNYIGTYDNQDLVFRTNNVEKLRIKANGDLISSNLTGTDYDLLVADADGNIKRLTTNPGTPNPAPVPWYTTGNVISSLSTNFIGPTNNQDFIIKTGSSAGGTLAERMRVTISGKVSIGIPSTNMPGTYKLYVKDGILTDKVKVALNTSSDWSDFVFKNDYELMNLFDLKKYIDLNEHLPNVPSATELVKEGGIDLGKMQALLLQKIEEQTLYIIQLNEEIETLKKQFATLSK